MGLLDVNEEPPKPSNTRQWVDVGILCFFSFWLTGGISNLPYSIGLFLFGIIPPAIAAFIASRYTTWWNWVFVGTWLVWVIGFLCISQYLAYGKFFI